MPSRSPTESRRMSLPRASRALALTLVVAVPLGAQVAATRTARLVSATERARINAVFKDYDKPHVPGCALGVMRNGAARLRPRLRVGRPRAQRPDHHRLALRHRLHVQAVRRRAASRSSSQEHKLAYTDDVRKYIPELPDYGAPITIDNLMRHTSGLRDYTGLLCSRVTRSRRRPPTPRRSRSIVHQRHLNFPTGSKYEYSNTGYFLLSVIIQRVTGNRSPTSRASTSSSRSA